MCYRRALVRRTEAASQASLLIMPFQGADLQVHMRVSQMACSLKPLALNASLLSTHEVTVKEYFLEQFG